MSRVPEGKKGRVFCAWCTGDMGEAETELDTHGCCLKCLKLALREMDERLSAFGQGQEAGGRARERRRAGVSEVAEFWGSRIFTGTGGFVKLDAALEMVSKPSFEELATMDLARAQNDWRYYVLWVFRSLWRELALEVRLTILLLTQNQASDAPMA